MTTTQNKTLKILPFSKPRVLCRHRIGPHSKDILEILIASLLGDGTMEKDGEGYRFAFYQSKSNGEYLLWLHNSIANLGYCKPQIPQIQSRYDSHGQIRYIFRFRTYTHSSFYWIYNNFYERDGKSNRRKKITPEIINDYLSPKVLAIWIMDDGTYHRNKGIRLCTNSFTLNETKILRNAIKNKFEMNCSIVKTGVVNQYNIYFPKKYLPGLRKITKRYMHPTMYYKLGY